MALGPAPLEGSASRQAGSLRPDTGPLSGPFLRVGGLFGQGSSRNSGPLWGLIAQLCFFAVVMYQFHIPLLLIHTPTKNRPNQREKINEGKKGIWETKKICVSI